MLRVAMQVAVDFAMHVVMPMCVALIVEHRHGHGFKCHVVVGTYVVMFNLVLCLVMLCV